MASPTESSVATPPAETVAAGGRRQKKRKRGGEEGPPPPPPPPPPSSSSSSSLKISPAKWRTETEQKTYSAKLIDALRHVRRASQAADLPKSRAVREAADRALAVAARGRTQWSRSILATWARKLRARKCRPHAAPPISAAAAEVKKKNKRREAPALETKAKALGRLVPGCRKLSFPTLLEEALDYIAALQMQVQAMTAVAELLAASGSVSAAVAAADAGD